MEHIGIIVAIVGVGIANVGVVISMMFWVRQESNSVRTDQKEDRRELLQISRNIENEMKDFHRQLLEIQRSKA
jgi:hypothetical protein